MSARLKSLTPERSTVHSFGALLRRLRIEAGLSQPGLAAELYTSKSTLSRAETGVRLLARDLAEACDALLGAAGTLIAAWERANAPARAGSARSRIRLGYAAGDYPPSLWDLALRARHSQLGASGHFRWTALSDWTAKTWPVQQNAARGLRGRVLPLILVQAERERITWLSACDAPPDPPPARVSLRTTLRPRPESSAPASPGSARSGIPYFAFRAGRHSVGSAGASGHTRRSVALMWIEC